MLRALSLGLLYTHIKTKDSAVTIRDVQAVLSAAVVHVQWWDGRLALCHTQVDRWPDGYGQIK